MNLTNKVKLTAGALVLATGLSQVGTASAADLTSGNYHVETTHTQVVFHYSHFGFTEYTGMFSGASGSLVVDTKKPANDKVNITIDVNSIQTTSDKLTSELKGAEWFNVAKYPNAVFKSTSVHAINSKEATVEGTLTMHGITKPLTLHVRFYGAGVNPLDKAYTVGFSATGTIKRSEYGLKQYVPYVSDDVHLNIAGAFEQDK